MIAKNRNAILGFALLALSAVGAFAQETGGTSTFDWGQTVQTVVTSVTNTFSTVAPIVIVMLGLTVAAGVVKMLVKKFSH